READEPASRRRRVAAAHVRCAAGPRVAAGVRPGAGMLPGTGPRRRQSHAVVVAVAAAAPGVHAAATAVAGSLAVDQAVGMAAPPAALLAAVAAPGDRRPRVAPLSLPLSLAQADVGAARRALRPRRGRLAPADGRRSPVRALFAALSG